MTGTPFRMKEQNRCKQLTIHKSEGTRPVGRPAVRWLDSVEEDLKKNGHYKLETKVTGSGPMARNRKRCQGSSWTVATAKEEEEKEEEEEGVCKSIF
jgi:hypothetical protein